MLKKATPMKTITDLPTGQALSEAAEFPVSIPGLPTGKVTLNDIRQALFFETAFSSIEEGLKGSQTGRYFFVFTDESKWWVTQHYNDHGRAADVLCDGKVLRFPTPTAISAAVTRIDGRGDLFFSQEVNFVQGMTFTLPEDAVNPGRGRKHVKIEPVAHDGAISEFIVTKVASSEKGSVETIYASSETGHVISWGKGENAPLVVRSLLGGLYRITVF